MIEMLTGSIDSMNVIASSSNVKVKRLVKLRDKPGEREKTGLFLVEGERLVLDTPAAFLKEIYVTEETRRRLSDRLDQKLEEADLIGLSREVMQKVSGTKTPQGILAVARQPVWKLTDLLSGTGQEPLLLILEDIQDPGNLGTMFRTAEAAGATGIIMSRGTVDVFNPKTVRATMSSIFRIPFLRAEDLPRLIHVLQGRASEEETEQDIPASMHSAVTVCAAMPEEAAVNYEEPDYRRSTAFLIGNEGNGLRPETAAAADRKITIPMAGRIESLNAAMSAGILLYEAARQRRHSNG